MRKTKNSLMLGRFLLSAYALLLACSSTQSAYAPPLGVDRSPSADSNHSESFGRPTREESHDSPVEYVAADARHCDQLQIACFARCWETFPPYPVERGNKGQYRYCTSQCLKQYMDCVKDSEAQPRVFPNKISALDWLTRHKTEVLVGTLIFAGGAVFIVGTGGAGSLILLPLVVL